MAPNLKVAAAFKAMRAIGIVEEKVKPVLKNLLRLYDKNWTLIEEENYRALADAIFENDELQAFEEAKKQQERLEEAKKRQERPDDQATDREKEKEVYEEPIRPMKKLRKNQEVQTLPSVGNPSSRQGGSLLKQPKEEVVELPDDTQQRLIEPAKPNLEDNEESLALSCPPLVRRKGKQAMLPDPSSDADRTLSLTTTGSGKPMSPTMCLGEKGKEPILSQYPPSSVKSTRMVRLKEARLTADNNHLPEQQAINSSALIKPKDEPVADDVLQLAVALPVPLEAENSSLLSYSVRGQDHAEPLRSHSVQDGIQHDAVLDAVNVSDKAINPDNVSYNSESAHEVAQTPVPMNTPPSNGNNCTKTSKDKNTKASEVDTEKESNGLEHLSSRDLEHQPTPIAVKPFHYVDDIANGEEKIAISLVNEVNDEKPPSFKYIPKNVVFQNAYVDFSLARIGENCCSACSGDCLSAPTPCACSHESGGEYAYTSEGLVKEDILKESVSMNRDPDNHCQFYCTDCPLERNNDGVVGKCQGHLMRRFIKECWWKCGCDNQCGNRVVQRGINRKLQVFMTPEGKGWGLRTLEDLPEGAFVCEYVGEILTNAELFERVSQRRASGEVHAYPVLLDADWGAEGVLKDEEALCLDATIYGNVGRFINHRCIDSNMVEMPVEVETPDHHYYHLAFFTTREVKALEELTWDYGIDFSLKDHPVKAFKCKCGSKVCRNMKRTNRSKSRSKRRR